MNSFIKSINRLEEKEKASQHELVVTIDRLHATEKLLAKATKENEELRKRELDLVRERSAVQQSLDVKEKECTSLRNENAYIAKTLTSAESKYQELQREKSNIQKKFAEDVLHVVQSLACPTHVSHKYVTEESKVDTEMKPCTEAADSKTINKDHSLVMQGQHQQIQELLDLHAQYRTVLTPQQEHVEQTSMQNTSNNSTIQEALAKISLLLKEHGNCPVSLLLGHLLQKLLQENINIDAILHQNTGYKTLILQPLLNFLIDTDDDVLSTLIQDTSIIASLRTILKPLQTPHEVVIAQDTNEPMTSAHEHITTTDNKTEESSVDGDVSKLDDTNVSMTSFTNGEDSINYIST